jgi:diaminopimelate epimerase
MSDGDQTVAATCGNGLICVGSIIVMDDGDWNLAATVEVAADQSLLGLLGQLCDVGTIDADRSANVLN